MVDASVIEELIPFLSPSTRQDVRNTALLHVAGTTASKEGRLALGTQLVPLAEALGELARAEGVTDVQLKQAHNALVNLSSEDSFAEKLAQELTFIPHLLKTVVNQSSPFAQEACMILSNLTRNKAGAERVLAILQNDNETLNHTAIGMNKLVEAFCLQGYNKKNSSLDFVGPLLSNLTQLSEARRFVLDRDHCVIQRLLPFTQYKKSQFRRRGVVTALKNCCFETGTLIILRFHVKKKKSCL